MAERAEGEWSIHWSQNINLQAITYFILHAIDIHASM